jgi:hypothetical protein
MLLKRNTIHEKQTFISLDFSAKKSIFTVPPTGATALSDAAAHSLFEVFDEDDQRVARSRAVPVRRGVRRQHSR